MFKKQIHGNKGKKLSEEHKRKIGLSSKNRKHSDKTKRKISLSHIGYRHTEEAKRKVSEANKGRVVTEEAKKRMSMAQKGRKHTEETKRKLSEIRKKNDHWFGRKHSEESKRKMSDVKRGEKHSNWQSGISFEPYTIDWTDTLKKAIRERDNYTCQLCRTLGSDRLNIHHIDYDKKNCNPTNLITLCLKCHMRTNYNRKYWTQYFKSESI